MTPTIQAALKPAENTNTTVVESGFNTSAGFELMMRQAKLLAHSTLVPVQFRHWDEKKERENPNALPNCVVALNMSQRMKADPLMVMQNLYVVEGRPSWSSQWIIASINGCGRFTALRFAVRDLGQQEVSYEVTKWVNREKTVETKKVTIQNMECVAWCIERETGEKITSIAVTMEMAVKEGWYGKSGSKWQTMPELMLRYRSASFFGKTYAPELLMGLTSVEETQDIIEMERTTSGTFVMPAAPAADVLAPNIDPETGEIKPEPTPAAAPVAAPVATPAPVAAPTPTPVSVPAPSKPAPAQPAATLESVTKLCDEKGIRAKDLLKAHKLESLETATPAQLQLCQLWLLEQKF